MRRHILLAGLVWLSASVAGAAPATQPSAEAKLIADLYGKRIAKAKASADPADDVALAREMLLAAADSVNPTGLRHLLAMEAAGLAAPVGSADAAKLATEALGLADKLKPLPAVEKRRLEAKIAEQRYNSARKSGISVRNCSDLASAMVMAEIALAEALTDDRKIEQANAVLASAFAKARTHKLSDQQAEIKEAMKALKDLSARLGRIRILEARLKRALKENDDDTAKASRQALGLIYLLADGDIPRAETYLSGTGHQYESSVAAAAAFLKDPKKIPPAATCNEVIERLGAAAKSAGNKRARIRIATPAMNICRSLLAGEPTGLSAAKTRLLLAEMERLAEDSPADRFIRELKAGYNDLAGKIEVIKKDLICVSYDFSRREQLGDWQVRRGNWAVARSKGILTATPQRHRWASLVSRLRFRADKPLLLTFRVSGRQSLTALMVFQRENNPERWPHRLRFEFGSHNNRNSSLFETGRQVWSNDRIKITPKTIYRIEIAWDGQQSLTWSINGKVLCKHNLRYPRKNLPYTSLLVGLETHNQPAGFDNVTVKGVILKDPSKRLPGPERPWRRHRPER